MVFDDLRIVFSGDPDSCKFRDMYRTLRRQGLTPRESRAMVMGAALWVGVPVGPWEG